MWIEEIKMIGILGLLGYNGWKDLKEQQISLTSAGIAGIAGFLWAWHGDAVDLSYFAGILIGLLVIGMSILTGGGIGMGDGILVTVLGMLMDWSVLLLTLLLGFFLCALVSAMMIVVLGKGRKTRIPFVPFLLAGYVGGLLL